jgi:hypothetical protein
MTAPRRQTTSLFPDTPEGMLSKAKALTLMCPDRENWTCALGFVQYKLAPDANHLQEDVLDEYMDWLGGLKRELEETGECREGFAKEVSAEDIARLMKFVVEHLYSL